MQPQPPPFIAGLQAAKKILLQLKHSKGKVQAEEIARHSPQRVSGSKDDGVSPSSKGQPSNLQEQGGQNIAAGSKFQVLKSRMNEIGGQLYSSYSQNQSYQTIFRHLASHYASNKGVADQNQKLKKKAFELQEHVEEYRRKIKSNYQQTELHQKELHLLKQVTAEQLSHFLNAELQRASETPLHPLPSRQTKPRDLEAPEARGELPGETRGELPREVREELPREVREERQAETGLVLRYRELGLQVARKPVRKVQCEEEEIRKSFYQSQLYSL